MWNVKAKETPVIIWANGIIPKSLRQYLSNVLGKRKLKQLQKNCHLGHWTHNAENSPTNVKVQNIYQGRNNINLINKISSKRNTEQL